MSDALALPAGLPPADAYWIHEDPTGIAAAATRALNRAAKRDWTSGTPAERAADFRGWLVYRSWLAAKILGSSGISTEKGALGMSPDYVAAKLHADTNERARLVAALGQTQVILRSALPERSFDLTMLQTKAGSDVAMPLIAIAVVTVLVAVAESAAVAYLAHEAKHVVDNYLARSQNLQELAQTDAQALKIIDRHVEREDEAKAVLPLDDAEKAALAMLEKRQSEAVKKITGATEVKDSEWPGWAIPAGIAAAVAAGFILAKL
jgi:hypothetical protein